MCYNTVSAFRIACGETVSKWLEVHEPNQPKINRNLLFRIDPVRGLIEVVRRRVRTLIDLTDFFDILKPKAETDE